MTISDYQISSVIKTYMKNMKVKAKSVEKDPVSAYDNKEDSVVISDEGMKRMFFNRIGEQVTGRFNRIGEEMTERLKRYE